MAFEFEHRACFIKDQTHHAILAKTENRGSILSSLTVTVALSLVVDAQSRPGRFSRGGNLLVFQFMYCIALKGSSRALEKLVNGEYLEVNLITQPCAGKQIIAGRVWLNQDDIEKALL